MSESKDYSGMKITIKKRHILEGRRCSRLYCPVNLAIKEKLIGCNVIVQLDRIVIDGVNYEPPHRIVNFMNFYDTTKLKQHVEGMTFTLRKFGR